MRISKIKLHNFRNYKNLCVEFSDGIHVIAGKNAQGKTNLLEALLYLSTTRSHRTNVDKDLIQENEEAFFIEATLHKVNKKEDLKITVNQKGKNLFIYQNPIKKVSDFIGEFNAVMFCPDDMSLFHDSPRVRRRFIDMELSKVSKKYVGTLYKATKLLKERNAYLKQNHIDETYLKIITDSLIEEEVIIIQQRYYFLEKLLQKCTLFYNELTEDQTNFNIVYHSCVPFSNNREKIKKNLEEKYLKQLERDKYLKQTTCGIHKEDFTFMINGNDVNTYASQGQKRSVLLALKIGMIYMIHDIIHDYPVLLLDDVFSELDTYRREKLLTSLPSEVQIFISTTDTREAKKIKEFRKVTLWNVIDGNLQRD